MTILLGGMRVLSANYDGSQEGVLTDRPGILSNDFFVNLTDMSVEWRPLTETSEMFVGIERASGKKKWIASRVDLLFASNSQLRALAEVYACDNNQEMFITDFVKAWTKVMNLDRFDMR